MLPLVSVPDFVHQYARRYRDLFSPSLVDHFERYLSGLYVWLNSNKGTKRDIGINGQGCPWTVSAHAF
jgi:hypothetical protein